MESRMESIEENQGREKFRKFRLLYQVITLAMSLVVTTISWKFHLGWQTIAIWILILLISDIVYLASSKDRLVLTFWLTTMILGFVELFADNWLVTGIQVLFYETEEPLIWSSPLYMPFLWGTMTLRTAFISWVVTKKYGLLLSTVMMAITGAFMGTFWESLALEARWWYYVSDHMIFKAPIFIVVGEILFSMCIPYSFCKLGEGKVWHAVPIGIVLGFSIWLFYYLAFLVFG